MIQPILFSLTAAALLSTTTLLHAEETVDGAALHAQNCTSCHGNEVYTRDDRRVQSLDALHGQVRMCEQNLGLTWFDDQVDAVTTLLNREFYKFTP
jgi:hypothetical protein